MGEESQGMRLLLWAILLRTLHNSMVCPDTPQFYLVLWTFLSAFVRYCKLLLLTCYLSSLPLWVRSARYTIILWQPKKLHKQVNKKFQFFFKRCRDEVPKSKQTRCRDSLSTKLNVHSPIPTSFSHINCNVNKLQNVWCNAWCTSCSQQHVCMYTYNVYTSSLVHTYR